MVAEWARSGEGAKAFGARHGVSKSTLFLWRSQVGEEKTRRSDEASFRPVRIRHDNGAVEIVGAAGMRVRVDKRTDERLLVKALRALSQCG